MLNGCFIIEDDADFLYLFFRHQNHLNRSTIAALVTKNHVQVSSDTHTHAHTCSAVYAIFIFCQTLDMHQASRIAQNTAGGCHAKN